LKRKTWRVETRIAGILLPFSLRFKQKEKGRKTLQKKLRKVDVLSFISPTKCTILIIYMQLLVAYLRRVPVQVYHLQGAQCTRFKSSCHLQAVIYKILQSVVASLLVPVEYETYSLTRFLKFMLKIRLKHFLHS
jgi:hypothetical protein